MLTPEERERVRAAVARAESGLSAEIVPCVYDQSSPYPEALWAGAGAAVSLACATIFLADMIRPLWVALSTLILWVPAAGLAGAAVGRWCRPVKRFLIGRRRMEESVARRAKEVFFDVGVSRTSARGGVLVFASLLERRVVVLADEGVPSKAKPEAWDAAVAVMTRAAADGRVADGLVAAVEDVAKALKAAGLTGKSGGQLGDDPLVRGSR
ncbi:MAG: hypothetical protein A2V88_06065 [Elusimicrobia bacterium RBG_16_66_12]|nr:MAG: hypothetical protein A2V88_06065 [Elusimicrobia bacterium RBG_16_66_12]